ncbi:uncharacterized protein MELLADRAFT_65715 [Melampsora larici-populina 98AG31]|uniref:Secreted protein n=1 Tax=Melampsora larici-populina (strain 98AG31 / pathotype 3-4-7) TaxID=747676 RepID=F4RWG2_MELLP|nr:uncharacterized protein MELLADRAFT_65715 [Melampsora larici-populina 98AG31]EGG03278.1 hypothetical protein MELLADRAFT_65715 [Melampsora larici-populina 98AG31]
MMLNILSLWVWISLTSYKLILATINPHLSESPKSIFQDLNEGLPKFDFNGNTKSYTNIPQLDGMMCAFPSTNYIPKEFLRFDDIGSVLKLLGFDKDSTNLIAVTKKVEAQKDISHISGKESGNLPEAIPSHTFHNGHQKLEHSEELKKKKKNVNENRNELVDSLEDILKMNPKQKSRTISDILESSNEIKVVEKAQKKRKQVEMNKTLKRFEFSNSKKPTRQTRTSRRSL